MRRSLACLLVAAFAFSASALGAGRSFDEGAVPPVRPVTGLVAQWDDVAQSFTLKTGNGPHEVQFLWTSDTIIQTKPKIGDRITVRYRRESRTRLVAEVIVVRPPRPEGKK